MEGLRHQFFLLLLNTIDGVDTRATEDAGRDRIGLIHYSVPRILEERNCLKILWVDRILTTSKY